MRKYPLFVGLAALTITNTVFSASLEDQLQACRGIADTGNRLACYDAINSTVKAKPSAAAAEQAPVTAPTVAPPAATVEVPPAAAQADEAGESFGKEHWESEKEDTPTVRARVDAVQKNAYAKLVVKLDNGQVWRQAKSEKVRIAVDDEITISRGMLNSFFFQVNDNNRKIKFSRVK